MESKPRSPYQIKKLKVVYQLETNGNDEALDRELERIFKGYGLEFDGLGFDFETKERDLWFYKQKRR